MNKKTIVVVVMEINHDGSSNYHEMKVGLKLYLEKAEPDDYGVSDIKVKNITFQDVK